MAVKLSKEELESPIWTKIFSKEFNSHLRVQVEEEGELSDELNNLNIDDQQSGFSDEENESSDDDAEKNAALNLRKYQEELAKDALQGCNTIVYAPTGSGKTKVGIHIMLEHIKDDPNAKIAFLARNVGLAKQQYKVIQKHLPAHSKAFLMTGKSTNSMSLHVLLPSYTVAVLTPQILVNHLRGREPLLQDGVYSFTLLVFDECHHTREGEPYNIIMKHYLQGKRQFAQKKLPQIIGLTATIGVEKALDNYSAIEAILKVCGNLDVDNFATVKVHVEELTTIVPVPNEKVYLLQEVSDNPTRKHILLIMDQLEEFAENYATVANDAKVSEHLRLIPANKRLQEYCNWVVKLCEYASEIEIVDERLETNMGARCIILIAKYLKEYHHALEAIELAQVKDVMAFLASCFKSLKESNLRTPEENVFYGLFSTLENAASLHSTYPNPNLETIANLLQTHVADKGPEARAIIFVRTRMLAQAVAAWLNRCDRADIRALKAKKLTGNNAPEALGGLTVSELLDSLDQFQKGKIRVLVATSVAQEGLDIQQCNLTIKYNYVVNEVATVQTRGRSRTSDGLSIILGFEDILGRERMNRLREELMKTAVNEISNMSRHAIRTKIVAYHEELYRKWDAEAQQWLNPMRNQPFKVVCSLCRKVYVPSAKVRTIYETYRVSIDRRLLDHVKLVPYREEWKMDELKFVGAAVCIGEPKSGKECGKVIGTFIKHQRCPFITLGIKKGNLSFHTNNGLQTFKKWSDVPYFVEELSGRDLRTYADEVFDLDSESDDDGEI